MYKNSHSVFVSIFVVILSLLGVRINILSSYAAENAADIRLSNKSCISKQCIDITGNYEFFGDPYQQWPSNFRGFPFSLDIISGTYISYNDQKKVTHVKIDQIESDRLIFTFFIQEKILTKKIVSNTKKEQIFCTSDKVSVINNSAETFGEATRGSADITDTYFLSNDDSLIVNTVILATQNTFFIFKNQHREEYLVKFKMIKK